jgi:AcrR family transcriptional regulator
VSDLNRAPAAGSLRARKRDRARRDLQRAAIDLVEKNGYQATTVDDICRVAEVSKSSFFRYFGGKDAVFQTDIIEEATRSRWAAPRNRSLDDLCDLICEGYRDVTPEDWNIERRRIAVLQSVPELRAGLANEILRPYPLLVGYVAAMLDEPPESVPVRTMAGAIAGAITFRFYPIEGRTIELPRTVAQATAEIRTAFDALKAMLTDSSLATKGVARGRTGRPRRGDAGVG